MNGMADYQRGYDDAMATLRSNPEDWVPVKAKVGKGSAVFSMRFRPEELDALRLRAKKDGTTISGFIRTVVIAALEAKPLAVVEQMVDPDEIQHLIAGATQIYFGVPTMPRPDEILVTVTITEGKP